MRLRKHGLLVLAIIIACLVLCENYLEPPILDPFDRLYTGPLFYPNLLFAQGNPWLPFASLIIALVLLAIWYGTNAPKYSSSTLAVVKGWTVTIGVCITLLATAALCSATDTDTDRVSTEFYQSLSVNSHVFYLTLLKNRYGGAFGATISECGPFGLICRAIHLEIWGTESNFNIATLQLRPASNALDLTHGTDVLYEYHSLADSG